MSVHKYKREEQIQDINTGKFLTLFQRDLLQKSLQADLPDLYRLRIQIMLLADEGKSQGVICHILGCSPAMVRHWMHMARSGMAHQWGDCPVGRPKVVNNDYLQRLQELVVSSPRDYGYAFTRWTVKWLGEHLAQEFGVELSHRHIKRLLKQLGLSTCRQINHHQQTTTGNTGNPSILIQDLKSDTPLEDPVISYVKPTLDTHLKTYGAKSTHLCAVSRTVQPGSRSFFLPSRISQLLLTV